MIGRQWHGIESDGRERNQKGTTSWSTRYEVSNHFRHSFCSTLFDLLRERSIPEATATISSRNNLRHSRVLNSSPLENTWYDVSRENDSNLLKEFRCAFVELTTDTHMHILLSSAIFSRNTQLSRCSNFDLNSRKTLCRDGKLIERTVNTFPSAAAAFRVCREKRVIDDDEKRVSLVGNVNIVTTGRAYRILWFDLDGYQLRKKWVLFLIIFFFLSFTVQNFISRYAERDFLLWMIFFITSLFFSSSRISALITQCNSHFTFATFATFFV